MIRTLMLGAVLVVGAFALSATPVLDDAIPNAAAFCGESEGCECDGGDITKFDPRDPRGSIQRFFMQC